MLHFKAPDFERMEKNFRTLFFNTLSGFKSLNLAGTISSQGQNNLAIFANIVHLGANPSLVGIVIRPDSVPRHTLKNILETKCFTLNHVHKDMVKKAHQTAARYPESVSEFEAVGLTPHFSNTMMAPYVAESKIQVGLKWRETLDIKSNNTKMVVGEVVEVILAANYIAKDGYIDLQKAGSLTVAGLDAYHITSKLFRLSYAKPDTPAKKIDVSV
jgi:flavin reductase (DIM6/NTAB) family NADH-FMN oxidoreductase RutF